MEAQKTTRKSVDFILIAMGSHQKILKQHFGRCVMVQQGDSCGNLWSVTMTRKDLVSAISQLPINLLKSASQSIFTSSLVPLFY
jgi:hypothetical protein